MKKKEFLVDVGYASPFYYPIPLGLSEDYHISLGTNKYVFSLLGHYDYIKLIMYRKNQAKHGYILKPQARNISEFDSAIKDSFRDSATFFNALLLVRFESNSSIMIHNYSLIESYAQNSKLSKIKVESELIDNIVVYFEIPQTIVKKSLNFITNFKDAWD